MGYIVVEGLPYSGKSKLVEQLSEVYNTCNVSEPYEGDGICRRICGIVKHRLVDDIYSTNLLNAVRVELFRKYGEYTVPNSPQHLLSEGSFIDDMVYYSKDEKDMERIMESNLFSIDRYGYNLLPDIVVLIDIPYEEALKRHDALLPKVEYITKEEFEELQYKYKVAIDMVKGKRLIMGSITVDHNVELEVLRIHIDRCFRKINKMTK